MTSRHVPNALLALALILVSPCLASGQWTNRYPKLEGTGNHVYVEGYELPSTTIGPIDPAPSPDGRTIAISSHGWLWALDLTSHTARRITSGRGVDTRPTWSPDGRLLAFVRDDTRTTSIAMLDRVTGREETVVAEEALALDPAFSADGRMLYYSSSVEGRLDLWRLEMSTGKKERITAEMGMRLRPVPHPAGQQLLYLSKVGSGNEVRIRSLEDGTEQTVVAGRILSQTRPALSPDGRTVAVNLPQHDDGWGLWLYSLADPLSPVLLTQSLGMPLTPAWSPDGAWIYFSEADDEERMVLKRISAAGGTPEEVQIQRWDWGEPLGRLRITTRISDDARPAPARLSVVDAREHPLLPAAGQPRFDGQNGFVYFYSDGTVEVEAPAGSVRIRAVQGLATPVKIVEAQIVAGETRELAIELERVWDAHAAGWLSGDHHIHLNYGGQYRLEPSDVLPLARGEGLDVATPLLANLHTRFGDQHLIGWKKLDELPLVHFGLEVRPSPNGHMGLVGIDELFWPWIWGPSDGVYGRQDRSNGDALRFAREHGGISSYVHPVRGTLNPFADDILDVIPAELIPDAVLGDLDALELACLWSSEVATSEVWYRFLSLGLPVVPSAGTDVMLNFHRTMAVGSTRVYVQTGGSVRFEDYLENLRAGRSFVTTGPLLDFSLAGSGPGGVVAESGDGASWTLNLYSAVPVERVEILVNGEVAWSGAGLRNAGQRSFSGRLDLPPGGWVVARALGADVAEWPAMATEAFAQTGAVWIGQRHSTDPVAARTAARELLRALDVAETRLLSSYGDIDIPALRRRFERARAELERSAGIHN